MNQKIQLWQRGKKDNEPDEYYYKQLAKMCEYKVDFDNRVVLVDQDEEDKAKEDLTVQHFIKKLGYNIQLVIPGSIEKTKLWTPLKPDLYLDRSYFDVSKKKESDYPYKFNDKFYMTNAGLYVTIIVINPKEDLIVLAYDDPNKANIRTNAKSIKRAEGFGMWKKVN